MAKRAAKRKKPPPRATDLVGKRLQFDRETWNAIDLMARDQMKSIEEITEEAFRDLLKKHGRPVDLKAALRKSAGVSADVVRLQDHKKTRQRAAKKPKR